MAQTPNGGGGLVRLRSSLLIAARKADDLAEATEQLEAAYANLRPISPDDSEAVRYFYVPTTALDGRELEPGWTDKARRARWSVRRAAIDATLALRAAVDDAIQNVANAAAYMDSAAESVDRRWTSRTIGELRKMRGAIVHGRGGDARPSALPMIRAGIPNALREHAAAVRERMEEVKTAILAGVQPAGPAVNGAAPAAAPVNATAAPADAAAEWDNQLRRVHARVRAEPAAFAEAGRWMDATFDDAAGLRWWNGGHAAPPPASVDPRCLRLYAAAEWCRVDPPNLRVTSLDDPVESARRVLLLVALLTDPKAHEYAGVLSALAGLAWNSDAGEFGRGWMIPDDVEIGEGIWPDLTRRALRLVGPAGPQPWPADVAAFIEHADAALAHIATWRTEIDPSGTRWYVAPGRAWGSPLPPYVGGVRIGASVLREIFVRSLAPLTAHPNDQRPGREWVLKHHPDGADRLMVNDECGRIAGVVYAAEGQGCIRVASVEDAKGAILRLRHWRQRTGEAAMGGLESLRSTLDRFREVLDLTTVPADGGGRRVAGIAHAVALSEAASALTNELGATHLRLWTWRGKTHGTPADGVAMANMGIGGPDGADAMLAAALESVNAVVAFPIDRWNAMQAARPGANHQRFRLGDVFSAADLAALDAAAKLLRLRTPPGGAPPGPSPGNGMPVPQPVTNGSAAPSPAAANAIDEADMELLAFLNRTPGLRRKVSDVLPNKGPQDRKAIAKRLRKLADRTPPMVDYPKGGRSGVAILPAGVEAVKAAAAAKGTPPTPH